MSGVSLPDPQRERLYELFERAVELAAGERAAFCRRECGEDEVLRFELEALLAVLVATWPRCWRCSTRVTSATLGITTGDC